MRISSQRKYEQVDAKKLGGRKARQRNNRFYNILLHGDVSEKKSLLI